MGIVAMVVAMARNGVIGVDNGLPWRLPDDMAWFRDVTMGKPVIMGRKTYASIPPRFRPLPGRHNIVITRNRGFDAAGATAVHTPQAALAAAGDADEIIIAGGSTIYAAFLPQTSRIYLTQVDADVAGDAWFPAVDWPAWREMWRREHPADERHRFAFRWLVLERADSAI